MRSALALLSLALTATASAAEITVTVTGSIDFNVIPFPPLNAVTLNDPATMTFTVDSDVFVDDAGLPTRGYVIDESSFTLELGGVTIGLQNPFPPGQTPYFVLRDNDPAVDGFFLGTGTAIDNGVPTDEPGITGQFQALFAVTYGGTTLSSLDIVDAVGTYDFTGLTVFNWGLEDGAAQPLGVLFEELVIGGDDPCPQDLTAPDGRVDSADLLALLSFWGACPPPCPPACPGDFDADCVVDLTDLLSLLAAWGACP